MYISLRESRASGFKRWSDAYRPTRSDEPGVNPNYISAIQTADFTASSVNACPPPPEGSL